MRSSLPVLMAMLIAIQGVGSCYAQDEALGRLFYTVGQRAALDANIRSITKKPDQPVVIPPSVTLNGIVTRSDGEQTVWIDGRPHYQPASDELSIKTGPTNPGVAEVKVPGVPRRLPVRVGQRLDPVSGQTYEAYENIPPATPGPTPPSTAINPGAEPASTSPARQ